MILRGRYWEITIGNTRVSSADTSAGERPLSLTFEASKSLDREPNKGSIKVANLSKSAREKLEELEDSQLEIRAGYEELGLQDTLFVGDIRDVYSTREDANVWTTVEAEDGGKSYRSAVLAMSFPPMTPLATVITTIAGAMSVGLGNTAAIAPTATLESGSSVFTAGLAIEGPAWRSLDTVCRSARLRWSVQNGTLQLRKSRQPAEISTVLLSPGTGLIGSPQRSSKDPRTGDISVDATSLIIPGLYPGKVVVLQSDTVSGPWMIHGLQYKGNTVGSDWYAALSLRDYDYA